MAQNSNEILERLQAKISLLMSLFSVLKSQNEQLKVEKEELQKKIEEQQNSIAELEKTVKTLQIAKSLSGSSGDAEEKVARKYIEGIVREIDSCIALLNK